MKAFALVGVGSVLATLLACTGLDPHRFGPDRRETALGGQAGYAYDAGLGEGAATALGGQRPVGTAGRSAGALGLAGTPSSGGSGDDAAGGEGGERDDDEPRSSGGAPSPPVAGEGGRGTSGHAGSSARGGVAGTSSGAAGRATGSAGAGSSGASGTSDHGGQAGTFVASGGGGGAGLGVAGGSDAGTGGAQEPAVHAFYFGEYVEGSASYKALELVAERASTLDGCRLVTYSNGSVTGGSIALDGNVAAGSAYTLCSTTLASLLGSACDRATNLTFNGDDAVALECDGAILDAIGQIGVDPGTGWTGPSGSTLNATLRRRCDRLAPDPDATDPFDPDTVFTPLPVDTFDGLGDPACG
jgi:hypothetical protein